MSNAINSVKEELQRHKVIIILPGEDKKKSLYLIMITGETSKLDDFRITYNKEITALHLKIAKNVFGENKTENVYGVLVDDSLRMVFAFNRDFADYDRKKKAIIFKNVDDVLMDIIRAGKARAEVKKTEMKEGKGLPVLPSEGRPFSFPNRELFPSAGEGMIKYSIIEKET